MLLLLFTKFLVAGLEIRELDGRRDAGSVRCWLCKCPLLPLMGNIDIYLIRAYKVVAYYGYLSWHLNVWSLVVVGDFGNWEKQASTSGGFTGFCILHHSCPWLSLGVHLGLHTIPIRILNLHADWLILLRMGRCQRVVTDGVMGLGIAVGSLSDVIEISWVNTLQVCRYCPPVSIVALLFVDWDRWS